MLRKLNISFYNISIFFILFVFASKINLGQSKSFEDGVIYLSKYIASQEFELKNEKDYYLVDSLFIKAVNFYDGDISEALLALTFATLPFNKMPVTIPIINLKLDLKLPSVNEKLFEIKKNNLPGIIYFDSNLNGNQDKDKVAHFFGNAFLKFNTTFFNLSKFFGMFVEIFESTFKVSGGIDFRDLQTNYLGEFFGYSLHNNKDLVPSDFFKLYSLFYFSYN
ncbi:MAG: hypothetical protein IPH62_13995 [Ignavibacteriae bacterium]|nr:hypothetical protein [Ignavibacteriota bacterium]